jgi:hypothetical protein
MCSNGKLRVSSQEGVLHFFLSKLDNVPTIVEHNIRVVIMMGTSRTTHLLMKICRWFSESFINRSWGCLYDDLVHGGCTFYKGMMSSMSLQVHHIAWHEGNSRKRFSCYERWRLDMSHIEEDNMQRSEGQPKMNFVSSPINGIFLPQSMCTLPLPVVHKSMLLQIGLHRLCTRYWLLPLPWMP